jgi:cell division protein FtsQ
MARESKKASAGAGRRWRRAAAVVAGAAVFSAAAVYAVHRYAVTNPKFILSQDRRDGLTIDGLRYAPRAKVQRIFAEDAGRSVFSVPLEERRRRLLAIDWVEDAAVSRVWPDRLAVRLHERTPVAFVLVQGTVMLIDDHGMLLELPPRAQFPFPVLSGVQAEDSPARRAEAVAALLRLNGELGDMMKDVSEVNAGDPENLRVIVQEDGRAVELILGGENLAPRYKNFVNHYAEIRKRYPDGKVFDLRLDDRILAKE